MKLKRKQQFPRLFTVHLTICNKTCDGLVKNVNAKSFLLTDFYTPVTFNHTLQSCS